MRRRFSWGKNFKLSPPKPKPKPDFDYRDQTAAIECSLTLMGKDRWVKPEDYTVLSKEGE